MNTNKCSPETVRGYTCNHVCLINGIKLQYYLQPFISRLQRMTVNHKCSEVSNIYCVRWFETTQQHHHKGLIKPNILIHNINIKCYSNQTSSSKVTRITTRVRFLLFPNDAIPASINDKICHTSVYILPTIYNYNYQIQSYFVQWARHSLDLDSNKTHLKHYLQSRPRQNSNKFENKTGTKWIIKISVETANDVHESLCQR